MKVLKRCHGFGATIMALFSPHKYSICWKSDIKRFLREAPQRGGENPRTNTVLMWCLMGTLCVWGCQLSQSYHMQGFQKILSGKQTVPLIQSCAVPLADVLSSCDCGPRVWITLWWPLIPVRQLQVLPSKIDYF